MSKPKYYKSAPPPPKNIPTNIPTNIPNQTPSFLGSMAQGMALGTGSAIGHKIVDSFFSEKKKESHSIVPPSTNDNNCNDLDKYIIDFNKCMTKNDNNYTECNQLLDMYMNCLKDKSV
jgi:hypothetical protein